MGSLACSSTSQVGGVLVDLNLPSTVFSRYFFGSPQCHLSLFWRKVQVGLPLYLCLFLLLLMKGILTVVVCLVSPVEMEIHPVHYLSLADYVLEGK